MKYSSSWEIPGSWNWAKSGEVIDVRDGTHDTPKYLECGIPLVTSKNLKSNRIDFSNAGFISHEDHASISKRSKVDQGDVLFAMIGTIGNPVVVETEVEFSIKNVALFKCSEGYVIPKFLYYLLESPLVERQLRDATRGGTQKFVSLTVLRSLQLPLPPLADQKRIAKILDAADGLRAKRRAALAQLDTLLQSTFLDLFGDPVTNPNKLEKSTLREVFHFNTGKLDSNAAVEDGAYPFFTCARETYKIDSYDFDQEALLLAGNNASADYSVKYYKGRFSAYQRTYVIGVDKTVLTYPYSQIALERMLGDLKRFSKGSNTKYLTMTILNSMPILLPPLDLQRRFAAIVESVERQKARHREHLAQLDTLFASLQQRAFKGEL